MLISNESPRWLARTDQWEKASATLSKIRNLPESHGYVQMELQEIRKHFELEKRPVGGSSFWEYVMLSPS